MWNFEILRFAQNDGDRIFGCCVSASEGEGQGGESELDAINE